MPSLFRTSSVAIVLAATAAFSACNRGAAPAEKPADTKDTPASATAAPATPAPGAPTSPAAPVPPPPPKPVPAVLPEVVARVNGEEVKKMDLELLVRNVELQNGAIPPERRDQMMRQMLDQLITYTLLRQESVTRKVTVNDAEVDAQVKALQSQAPNEAAFKKALADRKMTLARLRADTRNELMIGKMMEAQVVNAQPPTDAQVKEFYDQNTGKFENVTASHILIKVDPGVDEGTRKVAKDKLQGILNKARGSEDFAALAKAHSEDGSAANGGELGTFGRGQMVPAFDQVAFATKPGQISDIVTTEFGYHIIKVAAQQSTPFDQVSARIREFLAQQNKQQFAESYIGQLRTKSKVEVLI